jgi:hypothetical protein
MLKGVAARQHGGPLGAAGKSGEDHRVTTLCCNYY